jgi:hypothetical protein
MLASSLNQTITSQEGRIHTSVVQNVQPNVMKISVNNKVERISKGEFITSSEKASCHLCAETEKN